MGKKFHNAPYVRSIITENSKKVSALFINTGTTDESGKSMIYKRVTPLGDGIHSKQYKDSLSKAIETSWPMNKERILDNELQEAVRDVAETTPTGSSVDIPFTEGNTSETPFCK